MREHVPVVNEQDEIIAVKYRDELLPSDIHRIVAIWVTNKAGDILLAQRAHHKQLHPGLWGPGAAGAVSHGETYEEAARKELAEEIGLTDTPIALVKKVLYAPRGEKRFITWYKTITDKPLDDFSLENEVAAIRWFTKKILVDTLESNSKIFVPSHVLWKELFLT